MKLSLVIITKNEEKNISDCFESFDEDFFSEIIIIDDYSEDRTVEIVKKISKNVKVYSRKLENDFSGQRNFGLSKTSGDWVLFLDADERLTTRIIDELKNIVENGECDGYYIKRKDIFLGKKLRHGEVGDIKLLRIARKSKGKWRGKVHEVWDVKGRARVLDGEILHYPHVSVSEFLSEINYYSTIRAEELFVGKIKSDIVKIIMYPCAKFFLNYFLKRGFIDGIPGFIVAAMMSFHSFLVRGKLWLLQKQK